MNIILVSQFVTFDVALVESDFHDFHLFKLMKVMEVAFHQRDVKLQIEKLK